jgi:hypothetical protein
MRRFATIFKVRTLRFKRPGRPSRLISYKNGLVGSVIAHNYIREYEGSLSLLTQGKNNA